MNTSFCDLARDVILVEGDDAGTFLHSQLANDIASLDVGGSVHSLLLEPAGHVVALLRVVRHRPGVYTLDVESGFGETVVTRLRPYLLRARASLEVSDWAVRAYRGTGVADVVAASCASAASGWVSADAVDVVAPASDLPVVGERIGEDEADRLRVDSRWPRMGVDILSGDVPAATGVLDAAVSFTKGCYPGQELVERMDSRGVSAPVVLRVVARDDRSPRDVVTVDGVEVGVVTSVGHTHALARVSRGASVGEPLR